ncbi:phage tail tape measure protein [Ruminococcus sp. 5_1_39BFAA]|uniref:phage tail tape measure protein n=1 Tax=Ruminococcus sp. 5_1_39BFAA TaxID=457412 RepID=UPI003565617D
MSDFTAIINAQVDTSKAEAQLQKLTQNKKMTIDVDTKGSGVDNLNSGLQKAQQNANALGISFKEIAATKLKYDVFNGIADQAKEAAKAVTDLDSAMTLVKMTMSNMNEAALDSLKNQSLKLAQDLSTYTKTITDAVTIYANESESAASILTKATPTALLASAANMNASAAADAIQGIMNQFGLAEDQAMQVADTIEKLSTEISLDFSDGIDRISKAISVSGSVVDEAGMSFEKYAALVASTAEKTRQSGSTLGNAFKTIFSRISRSKDGLTTDLEMSNAEEAYSSIGISIRNADGDLRDISDTLDDLNQVWGSLNKSQKSYIGEQSAGLRQKNIFIAMMDNYNKALQLEQDALNSSGTAMEINDKRADSIQGKMQKLSATMTELYSNALPDEALEGVLDFATALAKVADNLGIVQGAIAALGVAGGAQVIGALAANWTKFATAFTSPLGIASVAVGGLVAAITAYRQAIDKSVESAKQAGSTWESNESAIQGQIDRVVELRTQLESGTLTEQQAYEAKSELLSIQNELAESYSGQVEGIDLVNGSLEQQIALLNQLSQSEAQRYLNENRKGIAEAEKQLSKQMGVAENFFGKGGFYLGQFFNNGSEESEKLKDILSKYKEFIDVEEGSQEIEQNIYFRGNAEQAKDVLNDLMTDISAAQKDIGETSFMDQIMLNAGSGLDEANEIIDKYKDLADQAAQARLIADTELFKSGNKNQNAAQWIRDYAAAIEDYNNAILSGDEAQITKAAANFDKIDSSINSLVANTNMSAYADQVNELRGQLNDAGIAASEFNKELSAGTDSEIKASSKNLKKLGETVTQFKDEFFFGKETTDATDSIYSMVAAAQRFGVIGGESFDDVTEESIQPLINMLVAAGILIDDTASTASNAVDTVEENVNSLQDNVTSLVENTKKVQDILGGQTTGKSISLEDFNAEGMEDYRSALEYVNGTMQLNAEKVNEIVKAKAEEEKATIAAAKAQDQNKYLENAGQIEKLREQLRSANNLTDEQRTSIEASISSLLAENSTLVDNCNQYNIMTAAINEATSAYQNWINAQSAAQSGDMFDSAVQAINHIDDTLNNKDSELYGRIGNEDYKAAIDFIIPESVDRTDQDAVNSYLNQISDYLTTDGNGNFNGLDIANFCQKAVDAGLMTLDESGESYVIAGQKTMQDFADGLGLSLPFVQAMFGEMEEFGAEFDWGDEAIQTLGDLGVAANEAAESLRGIEGNEDLKIVMDVSQFDDAQKACDTLDSTIAEMNNLKAQPGVDTSQVEQANLVIQYCVAQKQLLTAPVVMSVDTSGVTGELGNALSLLQEFQATQNTIEMQASVGADTSEAEGELASLTSEIQGLSPEVKATLNIDTSSADSIQGYIDGLDEEAIVKMGVDSSLIDAYEPEDEDATVKYDTDTSKPDSYKPEDKSANVIYGCIHSAVDMYNPSNLTRTVTYNVVTNGTPPSGGHGVNGTAHAGGTANASGNWGTAAGGRTLVGELGQEIVVDPRTGKWYTVGDTGAEFVDIPKNSIIFNHKQSESLLKYGFVAGRGTAEAWGTAMVTGGIRVNQTSRYNSTQHRNTGGSSSGSSGSSGGSSNGGSSSKKNETAAQKFQKWISGMFDFAEIRLTRLNRLTEKWSEKAENAVRYSYNQTASSSRVDKQYKNKQSYTAKAITATENEIKGNEKAISSYNSFMGKIAKQGGLKSATIKQIRDDTVNGTFDIKKYDADSKQLAAIKEYQTYYEKVLKCKDSIDDLKKSQLDLYDQLYNIPIEQAAAKITKYENALTRLSKTLNTVAGGSKIYLNQIVSDAQRAFNTANNSATSAQNAYEKAQSQQNKAQNTFDKSQKTASKIKGLSKSQKAAVKAGKSIDTKGLSGKALKTAQAYNSALSNLNSKKSATSSAKSAYSIAVANRNAAQEQLKEAQAVHKKYANEPSYKYKNYLLDQEEEQKKAENDVWQTALQQANNNLTETQKAKDSANAKKESKKKSVDAKASATLSKYSKKLSASQKSALKAGKEVSTSGLSGNALKAVKEYNAALKSYQSSIASATTATDKYNAAVEAQAEADQSAAEAQAEYTQAIQENAKAKFDNVAQSFESQQAITNAKISKLNTQLSYRESKGYSQTSEAQKSAYRSVINENQNLLASQQKELAELEAAYQENSINMSEEDKNSAQAQMEALRESILKTDASISDLQTELNNIEIKKLEIAMDRLKAQADTLQDSLSLNETKGIAATAETYRQLISNGNSQIDNLQRQNEEYRNQQSGLETNSAKFQELQAKIESNDSAIRTAQKSQEEWNNSIANLPYERIEKLLESLDAIADYNKSNIDLKSAQGEDLTSSDYMQQISDNEKKITQLESERSQTYQDYLKALSDVNSVYGGKTVDEWLSQYNQLGSQINSIKSDSAQIKKDMRDDVLWRSFERAHDSCKRYADVLSGIENLIDDDMLFDENGHMTDYAISQIANLIGEYENAQQEVQNYSSDIENLNNLYVQGYYTQEEYKSKLAELQSGLLDSASSMKSAMNEIMDMYKDMAQSELDSLFKLIDARNKALSAKKSYYDYDKSIKAKTKDIQVLEAQIAALEGVETAEAKAKRATLQAQLKQNQEDLNDTINEHIFELSQDSLDDMKETLQDTFDDQWQEISMDLNKIAELMASANALTASSAATINGTLNELLRHFGVDPVSTGVLKGYAKGTRRASKTQEAWVNELGTEMIVRPSDGAIMAGIKKGDGVVPADLTDNLFAWGEIDPAAFISNLIGKLNNRASTGQAGNTINQHYDSLLNVEGNVDSTVVTDLNKFAKTFYKGAYDYTMKTIAKDARSAGFKT